MPESMLFQVLLCIFAAFGLAVFVGELFSVLFSLGRPCKVRARMVLYPTREEDAIKALELAAKVRERYFCRLAIDVEGYTPEETAHLIHQAAGQDVTGI